MKTASNPATWAMALLLSLVCSYLPSQTVSDTGRRSPVATERLQGQGKEAEPGVVKDVPPRRDEDMLPRWLNNYMDAHPVFVRFLLFGLLVALAGVVMLNRRTTASRIKNFESYQRILREGRTYRRSMFADRSHASGSASLNKKAWHMFLLEEWVISETPFRDPDFGVEQMAGHLGVSLAELNEAVMKHVDVKATIYLDHLRVEHSINLMKDKARRGLSQSEIARESGFRGLLEFRKLFRIVTGVSVGRYRLFCRSASR
ncbi:MAG: AraC family transcriptional regulator [Chitinophagia bacterium]|nr:AraC family transcriptional regulator [Chitinophagia bacterium]